MPGRARSRTGKSKENAARRSRAPRPRRATDSASKALRAAIDDLDELFLLCDADDRVILFNRRWEAAAPGATAVGQPFEDFLRKRVAGGHVPEAAGREQAWIEGRLAARVGDRSGAILAYQRYLILRRDPEPSLIPQRDSVVAELSALGPQEGTP